MEIIGNYYLDNDLYSMLHYIYMNKLIKEIPRYQLKTTYIFSHIPSNPNLFYLHVPIYKLYMRDDPRIAYNGNGNECLEYDIGGHGNITDSEIIEYNIRWCDYPRYRYLESNQKIMQIYVKERCRMYKCKKNFALKLRLVFKKNNNSRELKIKKQRLLYKESNIQMRRNKMK